MSAKLAIIFELRAFAAGVFVGNLMPRSKLAGNVYFFLADRQEILLL